jgi:diaminohydroxyphosphoribosylaminopyrimidine deaminase/5-amino-6-(5-phosphoribosylamino)uracil reductase
VVALPGADGHVDLTAMLSDLAQRGINELHIEAGERLNGALLRAGRVDELLLYLAPTLLGPGRGMAELPLLPELPGAAPWRFESIERCGSDLRILARRADADAFMG